MAVVFISSVLVVVTDSATNRRLLVEPLVFRYERTSAWRVESSRGALAGHGGEILSLQPSVSVVIRAKNEARFIGETLAAVFDPAALAPRQVVVVDSGSSDGTQAIVQQFPTTLIQIRPEDFTYGYALTLGLANVDTASRWAGTCAERVATCRQSLATSCTSAPAGGSSASRRGQSPQRDQRPTNSASDSVG